MQAANLELKGAVAGEQEMKSECNSLRLAVDATRLAVTAKDAECMRLQQSLHASRAELVELAAKHRCLPGQAPRLAATYRTISAPHVLLDQGCAVYNVHQCCCYAFLRSLRSLQSASCCLLVATDCIFMCSVRLQSSLPHRLDA